MKKISLLLVLIMCVTIGGVYAAWTYAEAGVPSVDTTISHGMEGATDTLEAGVLEITENTAMISIDQGEGHLATLKISGHITVRFTPNSGADPSVYTDAIDAVATIYTKNADNNLYNGKEIYVSPVGSEVELVWQKVEDTNYFEAVLNEADIDVLLDLGDDFILDEYEEYVAFHALEENITLNVVFSQKES